MLLVLVFLRRSCKVYKSVTGSLHPDHSTGRSVRITEGGITREEMLLLECIAISCNVPYTMHYKADMQQSTNNSNSDDYD